MNFRTIILAFVAAGFMLASTGAAMPMTSPEPMNEMPMEETNATESAAMNDKMKMTLPMSACKSGPAKYQVTFFNGLARNAPCVSFERRAPPTTFCTTRFEAMNVHKTRCYSSYLPVLARCHTTNIPEAGLVYSPMTVVTHSPRISLFTTRGYASPPVEEVCETGNNTNLLAAARGAGSLTNSVVSGMGPVTSNGNYSVEVEVTCKNSYLTAIAMIAPSPDWIVQLANVPMINAYGHYIEQRSGPLIAYDCGTDSGNQFTDPADTSLDIPTNPPMNIAPLHTDETDPFGRKSVGWFSVKRIM